MKNDLISVNIYGQEYTLKTDGTEEYIHKIAKYVESKMKEIRSKKTEDIKKELKEQGIKVSGKSNRLLKDIYLYSKMCNINIKHEK